VSHENLWTHSLKPRELRPAAGFRSDGVLRAQGFRAEASGNLEQGEKRDEEKAAEQGHCTGRERA
jgi:hypothetical protein